MHHPPLRQQLALYALTADAEDAEDLLARAQAALEGGATALQLRAKHLDTRSLLDLTRALLALTRPRGALCIVNDRLDIALAAGADGVHLGPRDLPVQDARALAPPGFLIGASAGTLQDALGAQIDGADYLGVGAIFDASPSKPDASAPRGLNALRAVVARVALPVVAIGGVSEDTAADCIEAGAAGVAVIRGVLGQPTPDAVRAGAQRLRARVDGALERQRP